MSTDRDTTRIVRSWLDEGATALPDRVLDAVLDQIPATPQRRAWWPARRFPPLNTAARIALAAVAVVALAFVGIRFLGPANTGGPVETASPTPATSPQPLPSSGQLEAGSYTMPAPFAPAPFTFTVPAGWATDSDGFVSKHQDEPGETAFSSWNVTHVYGNGCHWQGTLVEVGPTVDELANALASMEERETSRLTDVTLAGYPAKRIELSVPADFDDTACDESFIRTWAGEGGDEGSGWFARLGQTDVVYVVEIEGKRFVINTWRFPGTSEADLTELEGIIASIRFDQ